MCIASTPAPSDLTGSKVAMDPKIMTEHRRRALGPVGGFQLQSLRLRELQVGLERVYLLLELAVPAARRAKLLLALGARELRVPALLEFS